MSIELASTDVYCVYRIGASIVVSTQTFPAVFNKLINNPQCFLLYQSPGLPFTKIHDVRSILYVRHLDCVIFLQISLSFSNNTALEASAIFLTSAQQCSWTGNRPPYFNAVSVLNWSLFNSR